MTLIYSALYYWNRDGWKWSEAKSIFMPKKGTGDIKITNNIAFDGTASGSLAMCCRSRRPPKPTDSLLMWCVPTCAKRTFPTSIFLTRPLNAQRVNEELSVVAQVLLQTIVHTRTDDNPEHLNWSWSYRGCRNCHQHKEHPQDPTGKEQIQENMSSSDSSWTIFSSSKGSRDLVCASMLQVVSCDQRNLHQQIPLPANGAAVTIDSNDDWQVLLAHVTTWRSHAVNMDENSEF